eukprot:CAMPEP_0170200006 /NCGR_PEP_ID=MMETSP0040_2-20121228/69647_1 /TAXON_ID=641309 /ORGANISM="Lotharella oceanica, Strain CCMP622" /LENGTH=486 /DNA_ID=CAMNT_0010450173 /DNA_START=9 /DNA_END=1469 /DNA_ORIENTATION=-
MGANSEADTKSVAERFSAAQKMREKINAMLIAQGKLKKDDVKPVPLTKEITINNSSNRIMLTKRTTHKMISDRSKATVTIRGQYVAPGNKPPMGTKPLYLYITASKQEELAAAEKIITTIMNAGKTPATSIFESQPKVAPAKKPAMNAITLPKSIGATSKVAEKSQKVFIKLKVIDCTALGYPLLEKLSGPNDSYLQHIKQNSGATVSIRGKGTQISPDQPLHFHVAAPSANDKAVSDAVSLAENLLQTIYKDFSVKTGKSVGDAAQPKPPPPPPPPVGAPSLPPGIGAQPQNHAPPQHTGYGYNSGAGYNQGYGQPQYGYSQGYGNSYYGYNNSQYPPYGGYPSPYGNPGPQAQNYSAVPPPYSSPAASPGEQSSDTKSDRDSERDRDKDRDRDRDRRRRDRDRRRRDRSPSESPPRRKRFSEGPVKRKFEEDNDDSPPRKRSFSEEAPKVEKVSSARYPPWQVQLITNENRFVIVAKRRIKTAA